MLEMRVDVPYLNKVFEQTIYRYKFINSSHVYMLFMEINGLFDVRTCKLYTNFNYRNVIQFIYCITKT